ncbi:hypothetical protein L1N85_04945 [Paenibacillus alkaliterrae]|uniref:hypothetical protein n=1 Tax=Paenibacillus alkaliterrae TaxID=320909 RepID=UPI001F2CB80C|nr:hypothetical protein [Paenibacillus alkaliterrae]MCF2937782.1 hypothetical protein [Paenibacillus alkaliterrae]
MMRFKDCFYCVSCGEMVANPEADIVFRTGFFQVVHPMGYCLACSIEEEKHHSSAKSPGKTSNYDLKMFLRADAKVAEHNVHPYSY